MARARKKMSDATLVTIVEQRANDAGAATGTGAGALNAFRTKALKYYRGDPFGGEQAGRSQVVSRDVQETIDSMMPSIMKVFSSGDEVVAFEPHGPKDEEGAKQATEWCNWVWQTQNPGFRIFYWWFKDALMFRQGVIKIWWDKTPRRTREVYDGLTEGQAQMLREDPDIEVTEETAPYLDLAAASQPQPPAMPGMMPQAPQAPPMLVDLTVTRTNKTGRIKVACVPLEEFLLSRRAIDIESATLTGQRSKKSLSELLAAGYDQKLLDSLPSEDVFDLDTEKVDRFKDDDEVGTGASESGTMDPSMRFVWVTDVYMCVDYDGDGIAEMRHVCVAGGKILDNEEVDDNPYAMCVPILMQHKAIGQSVTDQVMDLQLVKSTLQRQFLDNLYLQSSPQVAADDSRLVDIDELLTRRVGGVVRTKGSPADVVVPLPTQFVGGEVLNAIEYIDTTKEQRTGVTRYNQGLDPNSLNKTATGINIISNAAAARIELVTRCFAEGGVKTAFTKILKLGAENSTKAQLIRMRGKWVEVDPRTWKNGFDAVATVGLGTGSKDQQLAHLMAKINIDAQIIKLQNGLAGPILKAEGVYNTLKKLVEFMGFKSVEQFYTDPAQQQAQPQQQQPSPEQQKAMAEEQRAESDHALEQQKQAAEGQRVQVKMAAEEQRAQDNHARAMELKDKDVQKANIDLTIAQLNARVKAGEMLQPEDVPTPEMPDPNAQGEQQLKMRQIDLAHRKLDAEELSLSDPPQDGEATPTKAVGQLGRILESMRASQEKLQASQQQQTEMLAQLMRVMAAPKVGKRQSDGSIHVSTLMN